MDIEVAAAAALAVGGLIVFRKYLRYIDAKDTIEFSENIMQKAIEDIKTAPEHELHLYPVSLFILDAYGKKREEAAAYMEKHKWIGKLVEIFPL